MKSHCVLHLNSDQLCSHSHNSSAFSDGRACKWPTRSIIRHTNDMLSHLSAHVWLDTLLLPWRLYYPSAPMIQLACCDTAGAIVQLCSYLASLPCLAEVALPCMDIFYFNQQVCFCRFFMAC